MPTLTAAGRTLAYEWIAANAGASARDAAAAPVLVFLHEGLGSIAQWRDFPARLARATGCNALVYDRYGYGQSDVLVEPRRSVRFMHEEALEALPEVLAARGIASPLLVGHSDGASIALIHAGAGHAVRGVAVLAPHVFVEDGGLRSIEDTAAQFETGGLREGLARYHRDPVRTFRMWADVWLDPAFRRWNIEEYLPGIRCPVMGIQGEDDVYGTSAHLAAIEKQVSGPCEQVWLARCGHSPFRDQPEATLAALTRFVRGVIGP